MPKTLAALPNSQYATVFDDVSGKLDLLLLSPPFSLPALFTSDCTSATTVCVEADLAEAQEKARENFGGSWVVFADKREREDAFED
jgi:hypothetical protein